MGKVIQLAAHRQGAAARPSVMPAHLSAEPGKVILEFSNGAGLDLSPANARVWAERLAAMADVAEALEREGGRG